MTAFRLFLHVFAASIWVGGQFVLMALVPTLRTVGGDAPKLAARRFNRIAWPAFAVLVATGIWNIVAIDAPWTGRYGTTLILKIAVVAVSGISAGAHAASTSTAGLAVWGATAGLSA